MSVSFWESDVGAAAGFDVRFRARLDYFIAKLRHLLYARGQLRSLHGEFGGEIKAGRCRLEDSRLSCRRMVASPTWSWPAGSASRRRPACAGCRALEQSGLIRGYRTLLDQKRCSASTSPPSPWSGSPPRRKPTCSPSRRWCSGWEHRARLLDAVRRGRFHSLVRRAGPAILPGLHHWRTDQGARRSTACAPR